MKILSKIGSGIKHYIQTTDLGLLFLCILLSSISAIFLYGLYLTGWSYLDRVKTQTIASLIGLFLAILLSVIDYRVLYRLWVVILPVCVIAVALTFFIGVERGSNRAWLTIRMAGISFSLQPAEFLKIAFILTFSRHLNSVRHSLNHISTVALLCVHGAAYMGMIVLQNDSGTALVFMGMFLIMLFMAGIDWKYILSAIMFLPLMGWLAWEKVMSMDQKMRFIVLWDPAASERYAYQQLQGLKALGVGGIQGVGFGGKHVYVPESHNDFIFTFIGQTTGLIGLIALMLLLFLVILRIIRASSIARDLNGRSICVGVLAIILVQSIMNIGMCINVLPVIGVTLPFLSAGGTSVMALYLGIGLVLSVYRHSEQGLFSKSL